MFTRSIVVAAFLSIVTISCGGGSDRPGARTSAVYSMSNGKAGNAVLMFPALADGTLAAPASFATGGSGTGGSLENQGALVITQDGKFLLAVNPGSDDVSVFGLADAIPRLISTTPSGGRRPISISARSGLVYVLNSGGNAGSTNNVTGFRLGSDGSLAQIPGSTLPLSASVTNPAQVELGPNADLLVVTEQGRNALGVYTVSAGGVPAGPIVNPSAGAGPFGFTFGGSNRIFVSEAGTSSASSYDVSSNGALQTISGAVANRQRASCWLVLAPDGRFAYTANTGSNSISGYRVGGDGTLDLLTPGGVTAAVSAAPFDIAVSRSGDVLYVLTGRDGIEVFTIDSSTGGLAPTQKLGGLPSGSNGLATF